MTGLAELILYLKPSGTILTIDIEKCKDSELDQGLLDGEKPTGNSSEDIIAALEGLGFEDIDVKRGGSGTRSYRALTFDGTRCTL